MAAISAPAIQRLAAAAAMPYATVERMTRPLIALDRWPSRSRKKLLESDLTSLLNAMVGQQTTEAATSDAMLRALEYKSTWPDTTKQVPALGEGTWGDLLERVIRNAPAELYPTVPWTAGMDNYSGHLPHDIEACLNPLQLVLVWRHGLTGAPDRVDYYGPARGDLTPHYPYGLATLLIRKCLLHPRMIVIAGQILRDASPKAKNETAASPGRVAAARKPGPTKAPDSFNTRKTMRALSLSQGQSHDGPGPSHLPRRKIDGRRRHQNTPDAGYVRVARAD